MEYREEATHIDLSGWDALVKELDFNDGSHTTFEGKIVIDENGKRIVNREYREDETAKE